MHQIHVHRSISLQSETSHILISMAGAIATALLLLVLAAANPAHAVDYTVGDSSGWTSSMDYDNWLSGKTFNVGDTLLFSYGLLHSLDEVSQSDYNSCTSANSVQSYADGSTTIKLTAPGTRYFICGTPSHCSGGMKLAVTVASGSVSGTGSGTGTGTSTGNSNGIDNGNGNGNSALSPNAPLPLTPSFKPTGRVTPQTNINAAGSSGASVVIAGVTTLVGLALMG